MKTRPEIDLPRHTPAFAAVPTRLQRLLCRVVEIWSRVLGDLASRMKSIKVRRVAMIWIVFLVVLNPFLHPFETRLAA